MIKNFKPLFASIVVITILFIDFSFEISNNKNSTSKLFKKKGKYNFLLLQQKRALAEENLPYKVEFNENIESGSKLSLTSKLGILAYTTSDNSIIINDNGIIKSLTGYKPKFKIRSIAISNNGKYLVTGEGKTDERFGSSSENPSYRIAIWNIAQRKYIGRIENLFGGNVRSLDFSPEDQYFASAHGGQNIGVLVWNFPAIIEEISSGDNIIDFKLLKKNSAKAKKLFQRIEDSDSIYSESVVFDPNGKWIATSGSSKTIKFFALPKLNRIRTLLLDGAYKGASQLAVNHKGSKLAAALRVNDGGENSGLLSLWDIENISNIPEPLQIKTKESVSSVDFSNDGEKLVFGTEGGKATVLDLENNSEIAYFDLDSAKDDPPHSIESVAFVSGGENQNSSFYTANSTGTVDKWNLVENKEPYNPGSSISGIILILLSLIGLALLWLSHKSLKDIICFWDDVNNLIKQGKELNEPLKASANEIERSSNSIENIADKLGEADLRGICIQKVKDDRVIEQTNFDLEPVIDNLNDTSRSMKKVKGQVDSMANITKNMFSIDDNKIPTKKRVLSVINPIYLLMSIFLVSVLGLGVYKIAKSNKNTNSKVLLNRHLYSDKRTYTLYVKNIS